MERQLLTGTLFPAGNATSAPQHSPCPRSALANVINAHDAHFFGTRANKADRSRGQKCRCAEKIAAFWPSNFRGIKPLSSEHAMQPRDWVWTYIRRCCGENFQWEKEQLGVEEGATGGEWRIIGKIALFHVFRLLLHSKSARADSCRRNVWIFSWFWLSPVFSFGIELNCCCAKMKMNP